MLLLLFLLAVAVNEAISHFYPVESPVPPACPANIPTPTGECVLLFHDKPTVFILISTSWSFEDAASIPVWEKAQDLGLARWIMHFLVTKGLPQAWVPGLTHTQWEPIRKY